MPTGRTEPEGRLVPSVAVSSVLVAVDPDEGPDAATRLRVQGARNVTIDTQDDTVSVVIGWFSDASRAQEVSRALRATGESAVAGPASPSGMSTWDRHTAPLRLEDGSCICFPWSRFDRSRHDRVITIDPAGGFGAGHHPTTVLILEMLPLDLQGVRVVDVGSGSGILSIVAAVRGANAIAIDVDPAAAAATAANAQRNGVADRVTASTTPLADLRGVADLVLANTHAATLEMLSADLRRVTDEGTLIVSGISSPQLSPLRVALGSPRLIDRRDAEGWVAAAVRWE